jgi:integrase/recombinase XerC
MLDERLDRLMLDFLAMLRLRLAAVTCIGEKRKLLHFFRHLLLSKKDYTTVTRQDVEDYLLLQKWQQHTRRTVWFCISRFYDYLKENGVVAANPAEGIKLIGRKERRLMTVPPVEKMKSILHKLECVKTENGLRNRLMVELAYGSGLRREEIATLNIEDVDPANLTAHVLGKGRKERVVPLTRRCAGAFTEYVERSAREPRKFLFKSSLTNSRLCVNAVGWIIKQKTGLNPHLFRHACATHLLLAGCNIRYIQELLGHEGVGTTQIYTNFDKEELRQTIEKTHPGRRRSYYAGPSYS